MRARSPRLTAIEIQRLRREAAVGARNEPSGASDRAAVIVSAVESGALTPGDLSPVGKLRAVPALADQSASARAGDERVPQQRVVGESGLGEQLNERSVEEERLQERSAEPLVERAEEVRLRGREPLGAHVVPHQLG